MHTKAQMLEDLRGMLRDVFAATARGSAHARVARAHGYVDGFMRALLDTDTVSKAALLELVAEEREKISGPATRSSLHLDDPIFAETTAPSREVAA
jgi:hypothetical protein